MDRRDFVKGATATVAAIASGSVVANAISSPEGAVERAVRPAAGDFSLFADTQFPPAVEAPPPLFLVAPLAPGSVVQGKWRLRNVSPIIRGGFEIILEDAEARTARVAVNRRGERIHGIGQTELFDLMLVNGGHGSRRTPEGAGKALLALVETIRVNEHHIDGAAKAVPVLTYEQRNAKYGRGVIV